MEKKCDEETQSDFLICLLELKFVRRSRMSCFQKAYHHQNHSAYKMIQTGLKYPRNSTFDFDFKNLSRLHWSGDNSRGFMLLGNQLLPADRHVTSVALVWA